MKLSDLDLKALELIKVSNGITQAELWKKLGIDSKRGSNIVRKLEKYGLIYRERVVVNGKRTYRIIYIGNEEVKRKEIKIDAEVLEVPCMYCTFIDKCLPHDVEKCTKLTNWLNNKCENNE